MGIGERWGKKFDDAVEKTTEFSKNTTEKVKSFSLRDSLNKLKGVAKEKAKSLSAATSSLMGQFKKRMVEHKFTKKVQTQYTHSKDKAKYFKSAMDKKVEETKQKTNDFKSNMNQKVEQVVSQTKEKTNEFKSNMNQKVEQVVSQTKEKAKEFANKTKEAVQQVQTGTKKRLAKKTYEGSKVVQFDVLADRKKHMKMIDHTINHYQTKLDNGELTSRKEKFGAKRFIEGLKAEKEMLNLNHKDLEKGVYEAKFDSMHFENKEKEVAFKDSLKRSITHGKEDLNHKVYRSKGDVALDDMNKYYHFIENSPNKQMKEFWVGALDHYINKNEKNLDEILSKEDTLRVVNSSTKENEVAISAEGKTKDQILEEKLSRVQKMKEKTMTYEATKQQMYNKQGNKRLENAQLHSLDKVRQSANSKDKGLGF